MNRIEFGPAQYPEPDSDQRRREEQESRGAATNMYGS